MFARTALRSTRMLRAGNGAANVSKVGNGMIPRTPTRPPVPGSSGEAGPFPSGPWIRIN